MAAVVEVVAEHEAFLEAFSAKLAPEAMRAMKAAGQVLAKGGLAEAIAAKTVLKKAEVTKILNSLAHVANQQAGKREMFGKVVVVKAKPAKTVVKALLRALQGLQAQLAQQGHYYSPHLWRHRGYHRGKKL